MSKITFQDLEDSEYVPQSDSALENWYSTVRTKPISDFTIQELCRSCRQKLYLDHVVPVAIRAAQSDITAGYMYEGELMCAIIGISSNYWQDHIDQKKIVFEIMNDHINEFDDDDKEKIQNFLTRNENNS